ncbi:N-6 DNA methylase [Natrialba sp. INN-245]|uniref:Eco57I restriction-modification methylase domain-containing protein n=1 Tax=Natrialba sp. INN-245 TaxID=2690967 RepID=UPI001311BFE4|nr:N-6 DNA methylase [Natrialba sp. INN-245]MWV40756.1 N-6 DNA methylase [Natrialba sp. INN-245]
MRCVSDAVTNDGLFSDGYLEAAFSKPVDRPADPEDERRAIVAEIADVWKRERSDAPTYDVVDLEEAIVRPILRALEVPFVRDDREPPADRPRRRPAYAIGDGVSSVDGTDPLEHAVAVADVRRWGRPFDSLAFDADGHGDCERPFEHPGHRMRVFLEETSARFSVLTDGRRWRLYGADGRVDDYCEVDLEAALEADDRVALEQFVRLFGGDAFREGPDGACPLDVASTESEELARERVRTLRTDVCRAVVDLASERSTRGDSTELGPTIDADEVELEARYDRAVRDVFRDLLERYVDRTATIGGDSVQPPIPSFASVAAGGTHSSASTSTPLETDVPLDRLESRHLGRLYESTLEYELAIAESERPAADGEYAPVREDVEGREGLRPGDVYLTADSGERKASGSYYTPDRVVEYVVESTLGPLVEDVREGLERDDPGFADAFVDALLERAILDPAIGTGRFLTSAAEFLVREIVHSRERHVARHGLEAVDPQRGVAWARRRVAAGCLYGVDLDPVAVGLARAALWERAGGTPAVRDALESHLLAGNALVGMDRKQLADLASALTDDPFEHGEPATDLLLEHSESLDRLERIANVATAQRFDADPEGETDDVPPDAVDRLVSAATTEDEYESLAGTAWFEAAQRRAAVDRYVHWPLAFPERFLEASGSGRAEPGFDAVVGNPPWVATAGRADISATIDSTLRSYLSRSFAATEGQFDLYVAFLERAVRLARDGRVGFVVPDSILTREQNEPIRRLLIDRAPPSRIVRVGTVFEGVESGAAILVCGPDSETVACGDATESDEPGGREGAVTDGTALEGVATEEIPLETFASESAARFLIYLDETTRTILERIDDRPRLSALAEVARGEEVSKRAPRLEDEPTPATQPIAPGSAIVRYGLDEAELRYVDPDDLEKRADQYRSPKLVFRQTSDSLVGTYDPDGLATIKSAYTVHLRSESISETADRDDAYKHTLGLLNSPLLNYYLRYRHTAYRSVFPQINQSTFESLPLAMGDGPDPDLVSAVDARLAATAERNAISVDLDAALGEYDDGTQLDAVPAYRVEPGVEGTMLTETTTERSGLRIDSVETKRDRRLRRDGDVVTISVRLRYKPADDGTDTDRWGYATTDPVPAIRFVGVDDDLALALETFVPHAVEVGDGFAGFRAAATRTITPLERLNELTLPRLGQVVADLSRVVERRERAKKLDERIASIDRRIHERVCSLYDVPASERERVLRECGADSDPSS